MGNCGSYKNDDAGTSSGAAYLLRRSGGNWVETQKITASDAAANDWFGNDVAINGNYAVVGAPGDDDLGSSSGSIYIFEYNGVSWVQSQKITQPSGSNKFFGIAVDISGTHLAVGAWGVDDNGTDNGAAYIYAFDGTSWVLKQELSVTVLPGQTSQAFGNHIAIEGNKVLVGAFGDIQNGTYSGAAYVFKYDGLTWIEEQKLVASDGAAFYGFGRGLDLTEDYAVISSRSDATAGNSAGSAYVFYFNGTAWVQQQKLLPTELETFDVFGSGVAISNDYITVNAPGDDDAGSNVGANYIYKRSGSTWSKINKILPIPVTGTSFGTAVAMSGNSIILGTVNDNELFNSNGAVYFLEPSLDPIVDSVVVIACDSAIINGNTYSSSQIIVDTIAFELCQDSIIVTDLIIYNSYTILDTVVACDSALVNGNYYSSTQMVYDTFSTASLCDSVIITDVTINNAFEVYDTIVSCDSVLINGTYYNSSQTVYDTLLSATNCDSIVITTL
ncbi:MAG: FG-GAP repeat protein, partial [Chitinophagales bacterium]